MPPLSSFNLNQVMKLATHCGYSRSVPNAVNLLVCFEKHRRVKESIVGNQHFNAA